MVPSELTRRVGMGELLVLLVCWKSGPYGVPDQQGDNSFGWPKIHEDEVLSSGEFLFHVPYGK